MSVTNSGVKMNNELRMCRICSKTYDCDEKMINIFENDNVALNIFLCTQIKIIEINDLAALICSSCLTELSMAINFRNNAIKSDAYFRSQLRLPEFNAWDEQNNVKIENNQNDRRIKIEPVDTNLSFLHSVDLLLETNLAQFENVNVNPFDENIRISQKKKRTKKIVYDTDKLSSNDRNFLKCKYCEKSFKLQGYLTRHLTRTHSDRLNNKKSLTKKQSQQTKVNEEEELYCEVSTCINLLKAERKKIISFVYVC